jgi:hypothetical protein
MKRNLTIVRLAAPQLFHRNIWVFLCVGILAGVSGYDLNRYAARLAEQRLAHPSAAPPDVLHDPNTRLYFTLQEQPLGATVIIEGTSTLEGFYNPSTYGPPLGISDSFPRNAASRTLPLVLQEFRWNPWHSCRIIPDRYELAGFPMYFLVAQKSGADAPPTDYSGVILAIDVTLIVVISEVLVMACISWAAVRRFKAGNCPACASQLPPIVLRCHDCGCRVHETAPLKPLPLLESPYHQPIP